MGRGAWLCYLPWWVALGCRSAAVAPATDAGADVAVDAAAEGGSGWAEQACGACLSTECRAQHARCESMPDCSAALPCIGACPTGADGLPEATCLGGCVSELGGEAQGAARALSACWQTVLPRCNACPVPDDCAPEWICNQCEPSAEPDSCERCKDENCCEIDAECAADAACTEYRNCFLECMLPGLSECVAVCDEQVGTAGFPLYWKKINCTLLHCVDQDGCGTVPLDPCIACGNQYCAAAQAYCEQEPDCARLRLCLGDCDDSACRRACEQAYPSQVALNWRFIECIELRCLSECTKP